MKKITCSSCNKEINQKDVILSKYMNKSIMWLHPTKCSCPSCGAEFTNLDPDAVEGANPLLWLITIICLLCVVLIAVIPKPYSTFVGLGIVFSLGSALIAKGKSKHKFIGVILVSICVYLLVTLPRA